VGIGIKQVSAQQAFAVCLYIYHSHALLQMLEPMLSSLAQASKRAMM